MKKASRRHGCMWLRGHASGDGSISFVWTKDDNRLLSVDEIVTESDVSEYLRQPEEIGKWEGWDILDLGEGGRPQIKLVQDVSRPVHSSKKLVLGHRTYRYACDQRALDSMGAGFRHSPEMTAFYEGRSTRPVNNTSVILALCFFLNHEEAFCRRMAQQCK